MTKLPILVVPSLKSLSYSITHLAKDDILREQISNEFDSLVRMEDSFEARHSLRPSSFQFGENTDQNNDFAACTMKSSLCRFREAEQQEGDRASSVLDETPDSRSAIDSEFDDEAPSATLLSRFDGATICRDPLISQPLLCPPVEKNISFQKSHHLDEKNSTILATLKRTKSDNWRALDQNNWPTSDGSPSSGEMKLIRARTFHAPTTESAQRDQFTATSLGRRNANDDGVNRIFERTSHNASFSVANLSPSPDGQNDETQFLGGALNRVHRFRLQSMTASDIRKKYDDGEKIPSPIDRTKRVVPGRSENGSFRGANASHFQDVHGKGEVGSALELKRTTHFNIQEEHERPLTFNDPATARFKLLGSTQAFPEVVGTIAFPPRDHAPEIEIVNSILNGANANKASETKSFGGSFATVRDLHMEIHTAELGRVALHMRITGENLELKITSNDDRALTHLEGSGDFLREKLIQAGYSLEKYSIERQADDKLFASQDGKLSNAHENGARDGRSLAGGQRERPPEARGRQPGHGGQSRFENDNANHHRSTLDLDGHYV